MRFRRRWTLFRSFSPLARMPRYSILVHAEYGAYNDLTTRLERVVERL
jgi:hypothetical protein